MGIYQHFGELKFICSRTLHGGRGVRHSTTEPPQLPGEIYSCSELGAREGLTGNPITLYI